MPTQRFQIQTHPSCIEFNNLTNSNQLIVFDFLTLDFIEIPSGKSIICLCRPYVKHILTAENNWNNDTGLFFSNSILSKPSVKIIWSTEHANSFIILDSKYQNIPDPQSSPKKVELIITVADEPKLIRENTCSCNQESLLNTMLPYPKCLETFCA